MAHPCIFCGCECYCNGDVDDVVVSKTPINCEGCGCDDDDYDEEDYEEDDIYDAVRHYKERHLICNYCGYADGKHEDRCTNKAQ